jgi:regulator of replication initiation timing
VGKPKEIKTVEEALPIIADLEQKLDTANIEISNLKESNKKLVSENKEMENVTKELHEELKNSASKTTPSDIIEHKGQKCKIKAAKFNWEGKDYTADDLRTNEKLRSELIEAGAGVISLID